MDEKLEVLLKEYEIISKTISEFSNGQFEVLNRSILVFSGVLIYGLQAQSQFVLILSPIAFIALFNYLLYKMERNNYLQNYKQNIESQINSLIGLTEENEKHIFFSIVEDKKLRFSSRLYKIQFIFYAIFYLGSMVFCLYAIPRAQTIIDVVEDLEMNKCCTFFSLRILAGSLFISMLFYYYSEYKKIESQKDRVFCHLRKGDS